MQDMHATRPSRRAFLKSAAGSALMVHSMARSGQARGSSPSMNLRVASFGAARRAWKDIQGIMAVPQTTLVAVAEVDDNHLKDVASQYPHAKIYKDWRRLLDAEARNLDAVLVGAPDHMHAPMAMSAMQAGLHVYCEKPLTRTVHEARALRKLAEASGLMTQLGNQRAQDPLNQTTVRALQSGMVGTVKEIHCMQQKTWGSMSPLPEATAPPKGLDWDLWLGVRPQRPYVAGAFHPQMWRARLGFGCGNLGDMGCHIFHPWFMGLGLDAPLSVESFGPGPGDEVSWPTNVRVRWEFAGSKTNGGQNFDATWHDGGQPPPDHVAQSVGGRENVIGSGSIIIGTKGTLVSPHVSGQIKLFVGGTEQKGELDIVEAHDDHHRNFADAIRNDNGVQQPLCHFGYSARMSEAVLLGTYAVRVPGKKLLWDSKTMRFTNSSEANRLVREPYRKGWEIPGL